MELSDIDIVLAVARSGKISQAAKETELRTIQCHYTYQKTGAGISNPVVQPISQRRCTDLQRRTVRPVRHTDSQPFA